MVRRKKRRYRELGKNHEVLSSKVEESEKHYTLPPSRCYLFPNWKFGSNSAVGGEADLGDLVCSGVCGNGEGVRKGKEGKKERTRKSRFSWQSSEQIANI